MSLKVSCSPTEIKSTQRPSNPMVCINRQPQEEGQNIPLGYIVAMMGALLASHGFIMEKLEDSSGIDEQSQPQLPTHVFLNKETIQDIQLHLENVLATLENDSGNGGSIY